jgi:hypothetical protein
MRRTPRWLLAILVVSLLLNGLIVGAFGRAQMGFRRSYALAWVLGQRPPRRIRGYAAGRASSSDLARDGSTPGRNAADPQGHA